MDKEVMTLYQGYLYEKYSADINSNKVFTTYEEAWEDAKELLYINAEYMSSVAEIRVRELELN